MYIYNGFLSELPERQLLPTLRLDHGLLAAGPPCSLFIWLSSSVHMRHAVGCRGNEGNLKVKLANYITENLVSGLGLLKWVLNCFDCMFW